MSKSLIPKISLLIGLAIVTALTTSIVSRHLRGATNNEEPVFQESMHAWMHDPAEVAAPPKPLEEWDSSVTLMASLTGFTVEREGEVIHVSMDARALSRQKGTRFTWAVSVMTEAGYVVYENLYKDRVVTIPEGKLTVYPHFEDTLPIGPGVYRVVGGFLSMPAGFDLANADGVKSLASFIHSQRFITIGLK